MIFWLILATISLDSIRILLGEIWCWSPLGLKGLIQLTQFSTPEKTKRGMGPSFRCYDFWDHLGGQALLMIGGWHPSTQASSRYLSSLANFPDKLDRWRQVRNRWGRLGMKLGGWYSRQSLSNACPPKQSQSSLHQKLIPSLPIVHGVGNAVTPVIRTLSMTPSVTLLTLKAPIYAYKFSKLISIYFLKEWVKRIW